MNNTLIDNSSEILSMKYTISKCMKEEGVNTIRIATGYWDIPGMALLISDLQEFLSKEGTSLKLLIGKDPMVYASMLKNPKYKDASYPQDFIRTDISELADNVKDEHLDVIRLLLKYCSSENRKIEIRIYKRNEDDESQFLHSKCYVFTGEKKITETAKQKVGLGIVGSSNFTAKGLQGNAELNFLECNRQIVFAHDEEDPTMKGHEDWFEEKWGMYVEVPKN